jgi:hypothetical protein
MLPKDVLRFDTGYYSDTYGGRGKAMIIEELGFWCSSEMPEGREISSEQNGENELSRY